jgi:hypothetical protein
MTVYIAGARTEVEWSETVDRLIAQGLVAAPGECPGVTRDELEDAVGVDLVAMVRRDLDAMLAARLVVQAGDDDSGIAATVARACGVDAIIV